MLVVMMCSEHRVVVLMMVVVSKYVVAVLCFYHDHFSYMIWVFLYWFSFIYISIFCCKRGDYATDDDENDA